MKLTNWLGNNKPAGQQFAKEWESKSKKLLVRLDKNREQLEIILTKLKTLSARVESDLAQATTLEREYQTAMDALRQENMVLVKSTIPALVASHDLLLKRADADVSVEIRRQVAAGVIREPDE
jgi:hypothetical protein